MINEETEKNSKIDIATLITISGILLYSLGWFYWNNFFSFFKIQNSLIELTFEKNISTTWTYCIIVILGFHHVFYYLYETRKREKYDFFSAIWFLITSIFLFMYINSNNINWIIGLFLTLAIFSLIIYFVKKKNIENEILSKRNFQYLLIFIIYIFSIFYYKNKGEIDAKKILKNEKQDIQLTVKNENEIISGKLISFMSNKYFIIVNKDKQNRVLIINENEVLKVEIK